MSKRTNLGRIRIWASTQTMEWLRWLNTHTGLDSSRSIEAGVLLLALKTAEQQAGRVVVSMNPDGTDPRPFK